LRASPLLASAATETGLLEDLPAPADLAAIESGAALSAHFLMTRERITDEPPPVQTTEEVLARPLVQWLDASSPGNTNAAFQPSRTWLLGRLVNAGKEPVLRTIIVQPWRLDDVEFMLLDPLTLAPLQTLRTTLADRLATHEYQASEPAFTVSLEPGQERLLLIRTQDSSHGALIISGHVPLHLLEARTRFYSYSLVLLGVVLGLVLLLLSQRSTALALTAGWLLATTCFELSYLRPVLPTLLSVQPSSVTALFAVIGSISASMFAIGSVALFGGAHTRRWMRFFYVLAVLIMVGSASPLWTDQHVLFRLLASRGMLVLMAIAPVATLYAYRGSNRPWKPLLLGLIGTIWLLAAVRVAIASGVIPTSWEQDPVMLSYIPVLALLVLALLVTDLRSRSAVERAINEQRQRLEAEQQQQLLAIERSENVRLAAAVEERTRELLVAKERAEESSRAKSLFLSGISHDLRAPLHDVLGYVGLALREVTGREAEQLRVVERRGNELLNMINDLLEFVRGEAPSLAIAEGPTHLRELVTHLELTHRNLAQRNNIRLESRIDPGLVEWVLADEHRLAQLLGNLLQNACRYTHGGTVTLAIEAVANAPAEGPDAIPLPEYEPESGEAERLWVRFTIADTGRGIPTAEQARIFEPFERGEAAAMAKGTGLGLAIVRQLVSAMGGTLTLESDPAKRPGAVFTVTLPLKRYHNSQGADGSTSYPEEDAGAKPAVLLIDDEESHRAYLSRLCEIWGLRVLQAESAEEGLALLETQLVTVHAVVVDQYMPGSDAWEFLLRLRRQPALADLPAILVSTAAPEPPTDWPAEHGFDAYVRKPYSADGMAAILGLYVSLGEEGAAAYRY
jgi:signal transduction histidine kinase/ActR/RegA family two-component response regulator